MSNFPAPSNSWSDVARICRRVCVLREQGLSEEAERVRADELMPVVAAVRMPGESDASVTERLNGVFAIEAERVANAGVLAELLLPQLAAQLKSASSRPVEPAPPPAPAAVESRVEKAAPRRSASIADFIDDMIAQEQPPDRSGPGKQRRAS